jgi:hypothetical protein
MPDSWDEVKRICMHGVQEELDWHECPECQRIAEDMGWEWIPHISTFIFDKDPRKSNDLKLS